MTARAPSGPSRSQAPPGNAPPRGSASLTTANQGSAWIAGSDRPASSATARREPRGRAFPGRAWERGLACLRGLIALVCLAVLNAAASAQVQPPLVGQPEDFSGAGGTYTIRRSAAPTEVMIEEPLLLTVAITGAGPSGQQPRRDLLKLFPPDVEEDFFIEPLAEKDRYLPKDKTWEFLYRLRPKRL